MTGDTTQRQEQQTLSYERSAERTDDSTIAGDGTSTRGSIFSRRGFLAAGGMAALTTVAGCQGGLSAESGGTTVADSDPPEPPWTTDELAEQVEDGTEVTFYMASGESETWHGLTDVINDEFGTDLAANVFVSDGGEVSQRIVQERQADNDQADITTVATDLRDSIHDNGPEEAEKWFELGIDENFWFSEELPDEYTEPWYVASRNAGPTIGMGINPNIFENRGLDYPTTYNDLFQERYEGLETAFPSYLVASQIGWIIEYHSNQREMTNKAWTEQLLEHIDPVGFESHTGGARAVGEGRVPFMFYNFPHTMFQFIPDLPIEAHFPDVAPRQMSASFTSINSEAPNPWEARFVLSAMMEESVQRRMVHDVPQINPGRGDLDYSAQAPEPHVLEFLETDPEKITLWEEKEYAEVGRKARSEWFG